MAAIDSNEIISKQNGLQSIKFVFILRERKRERLKTNWEVRPEKRLIFWPNFSPYVKSVIQTNCQIKCIKEENEDRITYYIHTSDCTQIYAKHSRQRNGPSNKIIKNKSNIVGLHRKQCMKTFICLICHPYDKMATRGRSRGSSVASKLFCEAMDTFDKRIEQNIYMRRGEG